MKVLTTSAVLLAAMLVAGSAGACEWKKNVTAQAPTPSTESTSAAAATGFDPMIVAQTDKAAGEVK